MSLKKNIFLTFLTQVPTLFFGIIVGIFTTRVLGPEGKGAYAIFQSDLALFVLFLGFNINFGIAYFVSNKKMSLSKMMGLAMLLALSGLLLLTLFIVVDTWVCKEESLIFPKGYGTLFYHVFLLLGFVLTLCNTVFSAAFRALRDFKTINFIALLNAVFNFTVFLGLFIYARFYPDKVGLLWVLSLSLAVLLFNTLLWLYHYIRKVGVLPVFSLGFKEFRLVFNFIAIAYLSQLINLLNYRMDFWVLEYYHGAAALGLYALAVNIAQMMGMVTTSITQVLQPTLNSPDEQDKEAKFILYSRLHFTTLVLVALAIYLLSPWVVPLVYGVRFADSSLYLRILVFGVLFSSTSQLMGIALVNAGKVKYNLIATVIGFSLTLVLDFWLIPVYGATGAGIASSIVYLVIFIAVFYFILFRLKMPKSNYFIIMPRDIRKLLKF